jgi:transcriptional regulator with XRE-family HTH domain
MTSHRSAAVAERFGSNLRRVRRWEGLSQIKLAARASMDRTEVGLLERGERICRIDTLIRLVGAMAIQPGELLDGIAWVPAPDPRGAFAFGSSSISSRPTGAEPGR